MPDPAKTIGLTGGIGTGKTTVAKILEELGAFVIHADIVGHDVYAPGTLGWQAVTDAFGKKIVAADGHIDRKELGRIVFGDPVSLSKLNTIVHPLIRDEVQRRIAAQRAAAPHQPIVLEAAILIEAKWHEIVDEVWIVVAPAHDVIQRIAVERKLSNDEVRARIASQIGERERRAVADVVIENTVSPAALRLQVEAAWRRLVPAPRRRPD
jgi:dephospho-CoA kinase